MSTMAVRPAARTGKSFGSSSGPSNSSRPSNGRPSNPAGAPRSGPPAGRARPSNRPERAAGDQGGAEHEILFQQFFKSVGPRTYVSQVKRAANGNHYIVLTEGKRDDKTQDVRKVRLFVFSEDFDEFFKLINATAAFARAHPVPADVKAKRERFWARQAADAPRAPAPRKPGAAGR
jgi:hypothetical protein